LQVGVTVVTGGVFGKTLDDAAFDHLSPVDGFHNPHFSAAKTKAAIGIQRY
jgi:hypothetical protein